MLCREFYVTCSIFLSFVLFDVLAFPDIITFDLLSFRWYVFRCIVMDPKKVWLGELTVPP